MKLLRIFLTLATSTEIGNILELIDFEELMRKFIRDELARLGCYSMLNQKIPSQKITEIKVNNEDGY